MNSSEGSSLDSLFEELGELVEVNDMVNKKTDRLLKQAIRAALFLSKQLNKDDVSEFLENALSSV
jgi:hypothetical protein